MHLPEYIDLFGVPFERGGRDPKRALDCYGLVIEMYRRMGISIRDFQSPGTLEEIAEIVSMEARNWKRVPIGTPASVVTFRVEGVGAHVGFTIDGDRFVHAIEPIGVTTDRLTGGDFKPLAAYVYA